MFINRQGETDKKICYVCKVYWLISSKKYTTYNIYYIYINHLWKLIIMRELNVDIENKIIDVYSLAHII
jgi:hypothetical protein